MSQPQPLAKPCPVCALGEGARNLLQLILDYVADDRPVPSQAELGELLNVQKRTIARWVRQLREANLIRTNERHCGVDLMIETDHQIENLMIETDHQIENLMIETDHQIENLMIETDHQLLSGDILDHQQHATPTPKNDLMIQMDHQIALGGGLLTKKALNPKDSSSPLPPKPKTDIHRWLVSVGVYPNVAIELESGPLAGIPLEHMKADFQRLWDLGKRNGAIIAHWRVCPPEPPAPAANAGPFSADYIRQYQAANGYALDEEITSDE